VSVIYVLQYIWPYSKRYQFFAVVGSADKGPHRIDKLSNLAHSRRYLWNALPPQDVLTKALPYMHLTQDVLRLAEALEVCRVR
jgi:hypothetical protein